MVKLQRSVTSFRRQGSSGTVWDDKFLNELNDQLNQKGGDENKKPEEDQQIGQKQDQVHEVKLKPSLAAAGSIERSRSNGGGIERSRSNGGIERSRSNGGGRALSARKVSPAFDPPSPRISTCGFFCSFGKKENRRRPKSGKFRV
ncbi:hypothetical protein Vadar_006533 [Vaccinium darrowii]|uniref:Uncharacterized protein n=1 Tax=Vaccinium darrowii TaxID=229202 RepID=A0ACB7ZHT9_9ERIC|nr:hypothetical protein Vadar_006533 [Vaccinium darrowii]